MDEVLSTLQQSVVGLKSRRNNEAIINTLPKRNLEYIFDIAGEGGYDHQCITRISWACAVWRDICLTSSSLWRRIDLTRIPPPIASLFTERNKTIPFDLTVVDRGSMNSVDETFCIDQEDFIRVLNMQLQIPTTLFASRKLDTKFLEVLSLRPAQDGSPRPDDCRIADIFGTCPRLRHLSLDGILLPSMSNAYDQLQMLKIALPSVIADSFDILSILRRSPALQVLCLSVPDGSRMFGSVTRLRTELIPLLQLRQLTLELRSSNILHIMSSIITGPSLSLHLKATSFRESDILPLDVRCLPCIPITEKLRIDRLSQKIEMYQPSDPDGITSEDKPFLTYSTKAPYSFSTTSLTHLLLGMHAMKELEFIDTVVDLNKHDAGNLITLLRLVPDIRVLRLCSCSGETFQLFAIYAQQPALRFCHALESLYLEDIPVDVELIITIFSSLGPRLKSILVSRCSFDRTEERVTSILESIKMADIQVVHSQFVVPAIAIQSDTLKEPNKPIELGISIEMDSVEPEIPIEGIDGADPWGTPSVGPGEKKKKKEKKKRGAMRATTDIRTD